MTDLAPDSHTRISYAVSLSMPIARLELDEEVEAIEPRREDRGDAVHEL